MNISSFFEEKFVWTLIVINLWNTNMTLIKKRGIITSLWLKWVHIKFFFITYLHPKYKAWVYIMLFTTRLTLVHEFCKYIWGGSPPGVPPPSLGFPILGFPILKEIEFKYVFNFDGNFCMKAKTYSELTIKKGPENFCHA